MLKIAYPYKDKLQEAYNKVLHEDFYKFFNNGSYWSYDISVQNDSWKYLEFVSIDSNNNIVGYLRADIQRPENHVLGLAVLNFSNKCNLCFSKDLRQFLINLFEVYNFYKIQFCVTVGNPIEKMYDKYIKKYGGEIVGYFKKDVMLRDGKLYDKKFYEIFKENFIKEAL